MTRMLALACLLTGSGSPRIRHSAASTAQARYASR